MLSRCRWPERTPPAPPGETARGRAADGAPLPAGTRAPGSESYVCVGGIREKDPKIAYISESGVHRYAREVSAETVIHVTANAPWLPPGGRAEVIRCAAPPRPLCVARLLLRRADLVFCTPRADGGRLDLPMRIVPDEDPDGTGTIRALAEEIVGADAGIRFLGAVRNVVGRPVSGYAWPAPLAHFGVWESAAAPRGDGSWIDVADLRDRHWHPLAAD